MHGSPKYTAESKNLDYANPDAPKGGTLKQAAIGTLDTLNPYSLKGNAAQGLNLVYDRLMARVWDEPFTLYPLIAQSYEMPADRSGITFHLNPKARFADGSPITADDVLFSFNTLRDKGRPNMRRVYKLATSAEKIDERTIKFTFGTGYDRETPMIFAMMPILSKSWWEKRDFDATLLTPPLANGAYKIKEIDAGRRVVYERDPTYWAADLLTNKGHNNFDQIIYEYFRDDSVALEAFKAGDLDLRREYDAGKWATGYDFPAVKSGVVMTEALPHGRPERMRSFIYNTRRPIFADRAVREALSLALDFDWINANLLHGQYKRISSYFPNADLAAQEMPSEAELKLFEPFRNEVPSKAFNTAWTPPPSGTPESRRANLRRADMLLKQAGWIVKKGQRVNGKTGKPFTFEILLGAPEDEKIALAFIRDLKRLGITANARVLDSAAYIGRLNIYDFDMTLYYWLNSLSPGAEQSLYWGCAAAKENGRWNYAGICNAAVDALSMSIAQTTSRDDLLATAHALDRVLMQGYYAIPLHYVGKDFVAHKATVKRPSTVPLYGMVQETWWSAAKK
jgi:ABC-type oligopeptide transport system substrate-binding subunit